MSDLGKNIILWIIIGLVLLTVFENFAPKPVAANQYDYSEFRQQVSNGAISKVIFHDEEKITGTLTNGQSFSTISVEKDYQALIKELDENGVDYAREASENRGILLLLFIEFAPILLLIGVWIYFMRQMQGGGGGGIRTFGKSRARLMGEDQVHVNFGDVAGVEEAKEEVSEVVDFLRDPTKFQRLGGKIPRGVLMVGPPGTGKTLLARAIAGEAKVPFFAISGSDFIEMFVGVGASRVRDMFDQAKKHAPCIIFIDEIDAVGRHRGAGMGMSGGHDEREQTLNQLLVEMDGFEGNEGVIVIAATNRADVLDRALLRPGRFDRQVVVPLPDVRGREQILKVHMRKVPISEDVRPGVIARGTPGFSGADLANLVNEAALFAARKNKRTVDMDDFDEAKDKTIMGTARKSMVMSEAEKKLTAFHEAGHAIVGLKMPEYDPVYKVTIIPRGRALGVTMFLPEEDRYSSSKRRLMSELAVLFGGRIAEELVFGEDSVTTGASNDIERATEIATNMVTRWGLSEKLGPLNYTDDDGAMYMGRSQSQRKEVSIETAKLIDQEIRDLINTSYETARQILDEHSEILHTMAAALIKYETIDEQQIKDIMAGRKPKPPSDWEEGDDPTAKSGSSAADDVDGDGKPIGGPHLQP
ncbi:MAG: ATP-dependent metallopeptidase FtsH/Yme1/Tma family protein [Gammaproteobacteria bacterium]|nr:ATP-dependent metallopeptidase FtsH/Yme1/Tma family protein [Gammaproteobacteria bacterium]